MQYRRLGRTGLRVSVLSLGTGGPNRLGQSRYASRKQIHRLIGRSLELGINLFDTSGAYESSETVLGDALRGVPRGQYYLSAKVFPWRGRTLLPAAEIRRLVERSLRCLRVDEFDLLQLHRVTPEAYPEMRDQVLPELARLRDEGKFHFLGITESTTRDPQHRMLQQALADDLYDAVMLAYHPANTSAEQTVFPQALQKDVGVICMAVARSFIPRNTTARLKLTGRTLAALVSSPPTDFNRLQDRLKTAFVDVKAPRDPLAVAWPDASMAAAGRYPEACYAFALRPEAVASVLTGTIDPGHLESNALAAQASEMTGDDGNQEQLQKD